MTAVSAVASMPERLEKIIMNKEYPTEGIFAVKLFVKGKPTIITVDDYVPFMKDQIYTDRRAPDGSFWGPIIEKAFAKMVGNYELIANGWQVESFKYLTGAPSK